MYGEDEWGIQMPVDAHQQNRAFSDVYEREYRN